MATKVTAAKSDSVPTIKISESLSQKICYVFKACLFCIRKPFTVDKCVDHYSLAPKMAFFVGHSCACSVQNLLHSWELNEAWVLPLLPVWRHVKSTWVVVDLMHTCSMNASFMASLVILSCDEERFWTSSKENAQQWLHNNCAFAQRDVPRRKMKKKALLQFQISTTHFRLFPLWYINEHRTVFMKPSLTVIKVTGRFLQELHTARLGNAKLKCTCAAESVEWCLHDEE